MEKRLAVAFAATFGLGASTPLLLALYLGGENVAQAGIRLGAIEQGFSLAARHWQFTRSPSRSSSRRRPRRANAGGDEPARPVRGAWLTVPGMGAAPLRGAPAWQSPADRLRDRDFPASRR